MKSAVGYERNENYLDFVRASDCLVTHRRAGEVKNHAHHVRLGTVCGMGIKPSDYRALPLAPAIHDRLHREGEERFWREAGIDHEVMIVLSLLKYALARKVDPKQIATALIAVLENQ